MKPLFSDDDPTEEAAHWMALLTRKAQRHIDDLFGEGYAEKNPQLVGEFVAGGAQLIAADKLSDRLTGSANDVASAIDLGSRT